MAKAAGLPFLTVSVQLKQHNTTQKFTFLLRSEADVYLKQRHQTFFKNFQRLVLFCVRRHGSTGS